MATVIRQLRGTAAELDAYTPDGGVIVVNETTNDIHVGDGVTLGGAGGKGLLERAKEYADGRPLVDGSVTTEKLADEAVSDGKLAPATYASVVDRSQAATACS